MVTVSVRLKLVGCSVGKNMVAVELKETATVGKVVQKLVGSLPSDFRKALIDVELIDHARA